MYDRLRTVFTEGLTLAEKGYPDIRERDIAELLEEPLRAPNGEALKQTLETQW